MPIVNNFVSICVNIVVNPNNFCMFVPLLIKTKTNEIYK